MINLFPKTTIPYYIYAPSYSHTSSGTRTLHLLCHSLNESGQKAFLIPMGAQDYATNPYLNTPAIRQDIVNFYTHVGIDPIMVYPDIVRGNPLNGKRVVRYLLAPAGIYGGDATFPADNRIWGFTSTITNSFPGAKKLLLPTFDCEMFSPPPPGSPREGVCFYAHKYDRIHGQKILDITKGCDRLEGSPQHLAKLLRRSKFCYTYEPTELMVTAELCGCPVVMIRTPYFSALPETSDFAYQGARWNDEPELSIDHDTLATKALSHVKKLQGEYMEQLKAVIADTQAWS